MNSLYKIFILSISISMIFFGSCKKTEEDKENEKKILGKWQTVTQISTKYDTTIYNFESGNSGYTQRYNTKDDMSWEIKRGELKTFYKRAPSYLIGNDKYNSKGIYHIEEIDENTMKLTQYLYPGYQTNLIFSRIQ